MRILKSIYLGMAALALAAVATGCQDNFDDPGLQTPVATLKANTTIAELKDKMWQTADNYAILCPKKDNGEDYVIKGRVISSDASGNIYKSMYIQDETGAITLSINQNSLYNDYRIGQEVLIDVTGLYIGKYAGLEQIGGYGEYNGTPQVSFMAYPVFREHTQLNGLPTTTVSYIPFGDPAPSDGYYVNVLKISDIPTDTEGIRKLQSQLVEFRNVHFEGAGTDTFSTYQTTENRNLVDEQGNTIVVRTSGYSNFYFKTLPTGVGTVRGMMSYFNGTWQLILRSEGDCIFSDEGQKDSPYTIDDVLPLMNTGATGWVEGYIVGAVKAGVSQVTSDSDIIWSDDVDMNNNLIIGRSPETKSFEQCVVIQLPQGSDLRKYGNLIDNPSVYMKKIKVRGQFETVLGMGGVVGNTGSADEFEIEGVTVGGADTPVADAPGSLYCDFEQSNQISYYTGLGWKNVAVQGGLSGWYIKTFDNNNYVTCSAYLGKAGQGPYENWLISPAIDLSKSSKKELSFISQAAYPYAGSSLEVYVMTTDNPATSTSTKLNAKIAEAPASGYSEWVNSGNINLSNFNGVVYIGFKYYSDNGGNGNSTTWCIDNFSIGGATSGGNTGGDTPSTGKGTESEPYTVAEVISGAATGTGVWIEGYYVGVVSGKSYADGASFSATAPDGYTNTNFILGPSASTTDSGKCVPVQLPAGSLRDYLGLGNNPGIYLKHIKVKGNIEKYFSVPGIKSVSEYKEI